MQNSNLLKPYEDPTLKDFLDQYEELEIQEPNDAYFDYVFDYEVEWVV